MGKVLRITRLNAEDWSKLWGILWKVSPEFHDHMLRNYVKDDKRF